MQHLLKNILASGHSFDDSEYELKLKFILFNSLLIFNSIIVGAAGIVRFANAQYGQFFIDILYISLGVITFVLARYSKLYYEKLVYFVLFFSFSLVSLSFYIGLNPVIGISWFCILLMSVFFLKGQWDGFFVFFVSLVTIVIIGVYKHHYTVSEITIGILPFLAALFFMSYYEHRNYNLKKIIESQKEVYAYQAQYDELTGIPNRALFLDRLSLTLKSAQRSGTKVAVFFIDLDFFKDINDTLGHHIGDRVLQEVAKRLKSQLRSTDTVARLGGDEYAVIVDGFNDISLVKKIIKKLFDHMQQPFITDNNTLDISLSLGATVFPVDGSDVNTLLKNADMAMYKAKDEGRNTFYFYTENIRP